MNVSDYQNAVDYIESFSNSSIRKNIGKDKKDPRLFIDRVKYFLALLGNPEKEFSYIHVTGTAGKGTVSTMLQEVLTASGRKTGLFTSPYVTTTIEKTRVGDKYISPRGFIGLVNHLKPFIAQARNGPYGSPSAFELFFVIALLYFQRQKCQWVVLEVGLGGRYDATNVIEHPVVTAITNIDYDHTEILGKTLREIATDKSGIIKHGSAFFTSEQRPGLQRLFKEVCRKVHADFFAIGRQNTYQEYNKRLVEAIGLHLGILAKDIAKGITHTRMPCRFEIVQKKPLVILDGAHNRAKIRATISDLQKIPIKKLFLLLAISDTKKDNQAILEPLLTLPFSKHIVLTQIKIKERKSVAPQALLVLAGRYKGPNDVLEIVGDAQAAIRLIMKTAQAADIVLVTGSFFLAGEIRKAWVSEEWILENRKSFKQ